MESGEWGPSPLHPRPGMVRRGGYFVSYWFYCPLFWNSVCLLTQIYRASTSRHAQVTVFIDVFLFFPRALPLPAYLTAWEIGNLWSQAYFPTWRQACSKPWYSSAAQYSCGLATLLVSRSIAHSGYNRTHSQTTSEDHCRRQIPQSLPLGGRASSPLISFSACKCSDWRLMWTAGACFSP